MPKSLLNAVTPPLDGKAFRWSVGTRPSPLAQWLSIDLSRHLAMRAKDEVLRDHLSEAVITTAAGLAASDVLLELTLAHLSTWHTGQYSVSSESVRDCESGRSTPVDRGKPLETLARVLPQDFCVLTQVDGTWRMTAATVCFTSRWSLSSKMGLRVSEIHAPVPGYEQRVATAVDHVINRIADDQVLKRSNWTLLDTPELHLPEPAADQPRVTDIADLRWLRIEHQGLRRLPGMDAIVFTIDTRVHAVAELAPEERHKLREAVAQAPTDIAMYKGWPTSLAHANGAD